MSGGLHEDFGREQAGEPGSVKGFAVVMAIAIPIVLYVIIDRWNFLYLVPGLILVELSFLVPRAVVPLNRLWFELGILLGKIVSPIIMGVIYFLVVTPIGLCRRMLGKDSLTSSLLPQAKTYWVERDPPGPEPEDLPRQF